jgi:hypothetical protein
VSGLVDDYLAELQRLLPKAIRKDISDELKDHLQESASSHGEEAAVAQFGPAREVARAFTGQAASWPPRSGEDASGWPCDGNALCQPRRVSCGSFCTPWWV